MELAERLDRLWAAIIDRCLFLPVALVAAILLPGMGRSDRLFPTVGLIVALLFGIAAYQIWLLSTQGQTIGKRIMKLRIVKVADLSNGGFVTNVLLRIGVTWVATAVPVLGTLFMLGNPLFIFRDDRRCLHDHIAGTCVIKA